LPKRHEDRRLEVATKVTPIDRIGDDADDLAILRVRVRPPECALPHASADCGSVAEEAPHERLVHDHHGRRIRRVPGRQIAPGPHRDAIGGEEPIAHATRPDHPLPAVAAHVRAIDIDDRGVPSGSGHGHLG